MREDVPPPPRDRLDALEADAWALLLPHVRAALTELPDDPRFPARTRLRGRPTGRLAGGKGRAQLVVLLAEDDTLWSAVRERLTPGEEETLTAALAAASPPAPHAGSRDTERALVDLRRRAERDRARLREVREERDQARRRATGAERRADGLADDLAAAERRIAALEAELEELTASLDDAAQDRERAVTRERRRRDAEVEELRRELAALRRAEEARRTARREERDAAPPPPRPVESASARRPAAPPRLVPGRPSRLPEGVVPGTREAVELYLHRGRRVLVDGYNVTKQHQPGFDLEQQRTWLIQALGNLARSRGVVPTVVFDGEAAGGQRAGGAGREVTVRFTGAGITADDDIILELESTDDAIVVVTDDRELAARARASGADVLATHELLWLL